jgi:hypothetical protein
MKQPPEILYLQWDKLGDGADTSWTDVIQDDDDIIYIRKLISDISVVKLEQDVMMRDRAITRQREEITTLKLEICKLLNCNKRIAELETALQYERNFPSHGVERRRIV